MHDADPDPPELGDILAGFSGLLAFDIGANTGVTADLLAQRFAHVVAMEPCDESFTVLIGRAVPNVTARRLAVSDRAGIIDLAVQSGPIRSGQLTTPIDGSRGEVDGHGWGDTVGHRRLPATTIDALAAQHGDPQLLKVDVEGHELRVLQGATCTLERARPGLFIEVHNARLGGQLSTLLGALYPGMWRVDHPHYQAGQWGADNHYWLVARGR